MVEDIEQTVFELSCAVVYDRVIDSPSPLHGTELPTVLPPTKSMPFSALGAINNVNRVLVSKCKLCSKRKGQPGTEGLVLFMVFRWHF